MKQGAKEVLGQPLVGKPGPFPNIVLEHRPRAWKQRRTMLDLVKKVRLPQEHEGSPRNLQWFRKLKAGKKSKTLYRVSSSTAIRRMPHGIGDGKARLGGGGAYFDEFVIAPYVELRAGAVIEKVFDRRPAWGFSVRVDNRIPLSIEVFPYHTIGEEMNLVGSSEIHETPRNRRNDFRLGTYQ